MNTTKIKEEETKEEALIGSYDLQERPRALQDDARRPIAVSRLFGFRCPDCGAAEFTGMVCLVCGCGSGG